MADENTENQSNESEVQVEPEQEAKPESVEEPKQESVQDSKPAKPAQPLSKKKAKAARRAARAEAEAKAAEDAKTPEQKRAEERAMKKAERALRRKNRAHRGVLIVLVVIGCLAMVISVTSMACAGAVSETAGSSSYTLTGGVAATVNGVNITEDTISEHIMSVRGQLGYDSDADWAQYLVDNDMTPESYREQVINSYAQQYLIENAESENGIEVSDEEVQEAWDEAVSSYGSEETFLSLISLYGYDEDSYKTSLESSLAQDKLEEAVAPKKDATDDEIVEYLNENLDTYNDARRSSHILIKVDSDATDDEKAEAKEKAQECLDKINSGEMTWDEAVAEYSEDSSADTGGDDKKGDVGWDKLTSFVDAYQTALSALSKGEISDVVESDYGYHIIKCTNYFHVDGSVTSIDDVPKAIKKYVANIIETQNQSTAYSDWQEELFDSAEIKINDMPEGLPYDVSLDGVEKSSTDDTSDASGTTTTESTESEE